MTNIKKCPFCKSPAVLKSAMLYEGRRKQERFYVQCTGCGVAQPIRTAPISEDAAINRWNMRYDSEGRRELF